jgi:hypothetical protein
MIGRSWHFGDCIQYDAVKINYLSICACGLIPTS